MMIFWKIVFWTLWLTSGFVLHGAFISCIDDKDVRTGFLLLLAVWWTITGVIAFVKRRKYRKENPPLTKEQKQRLKQIRRKRKYRDSAEFKEKYLSDTEIQNHYFGSGVLVKDSSSENVCYTDIKSGFDRIFDSFGKKSHSRCNLYEFIVREDNIEYVLASLEKIYKNADKIMAECYDEIYKELVEFLNGTCDDCLKDDFDLAYLKENWYVAGIAVYDDNAEFTIGIEAAENPEDDSNYDIIISVDYSTLKPAVSLNVVW